MSNFSEKRWYYRLPVSVECMCYITEKGMLFKKEFLGQIMNVSEEGLCIKTSYANVGFLKENVNIEIQFYEDIHIKKYALYKEIVTGKVLIKHIGYNKDELILGCLLVPTKKSNLDNYVALKKVAAYIEGDFIVN